MTLRWTGRQVTARLKDAQVKGINATMGAAAIHAKLNHPWRNRTGTLERSIGVVEFAEEIGKGVQGIWGSQDVRYALIHELGGRAGRGLRTRIRARPYLRPAADAQYPFLARRIKRALAT